MRVLTLCQLCAVTFEDAAQVCHPEHARTVEAASVRRDKRGRAIDVAEASPVGQAFRAAKVTEDGKP